MTDHPKDIVLFETSRECDKFGTEDSISSMEAWQKPTRISQVASDSSSAYSGSDMMSGDLLDSTPSVECLVDSDDDVDIRMQSSDISGRDVVKEILSKAPEERTEDDIDVVVEAVQNLYAFTSFPYVTRRILCSLARLAVFTESGATIIDDANPPMDWAMVLTGAVELRHPSGPKVRHLGVGDTFGACDSVEDQNVRVRATSTSQDCHIMLIRRADFVRAQGKGSLLTRTEFDHQGHPVRVWEGQMDPGGQDTQEYVVVKATPQKLLEQLLEKQNEADPYFTEDFLLCYRLFLKSVKPFADQISESIRQIETREKGVALFKKWVAQHPEDFEVSEEMIDFFDNQLDFLRREGYSEAVYGLYHARSKSSISRRVVLRREDASVPLSINLIGGRERGSPIYLSSCVYRGLRVGDRLECFNGQSSAVLARYQVEELIGNAQQIALVVRSDLEGYHHLIDNSLSLSPSPCRPKSSTIPNVRQQLSMPDASLAVTPTSPVRRSESPNQTSIDSPIASPPVYTSAFKRLMMRRKSNSALPDRRRLRLNEVDRDQASRSRSAHNSPCRLTSNGSAPILEQSNYRQLTGRHRSSLAELSGYFPWSPPVPPCLIGPNELPNNVLRVWYRETDGGTASCVHLLVFRTTKASEVIGLALNDLGMSPIRSDEFVLCEVTAEEPGPLVKQRALKPDAADLVEKAKLNGRYYLKSRSQSSVHLDKVEIASILAEIQPTFLDLPMVELSAQLFAQAFTLFRRIRPGELLLSVCCPDLPGKSVTYEAVSSTESSPASTPDTDETAWPTVSRYAALSNRWVYWVRTEICSHLASSTSRAKTIRRFIRLAKFAHILSNIELFFAIMNGLQSADVSRLKSTWEKVPTRDLKTFKRLSNVLEVTGNMRQLRTLHMAPPPIVPMLALVTKDLTAIHENHSTWSPDDPRLVNFDKMRQLTRRIRTFKQMRGPPGEAWDSGRGAEEEAFTADRARERLKNGAWAPPRSAGHSPSGRTSQGSSGWWKQMAPSTISRTVRRFSTASINPRKMWEEQWVVRRTRYYLTHLNLISEPGRLMHLSHQCEPPAAPPPSPAISHGVSGPRASVASGPVMGRHDRLHKRKFSLDATAGSRVVQPREIDSAKLIQLCQSTAAKMSALQPPSSGSPSYSSTQSPLLRMPENLTRSLQRRDQDRNGRESGSVSSRDSGLVSLAGESPTATERPEFPLASSEIPEGRVSAGSSTPTHSPTNVVGAQKRDNVTTK